MIDYGGKLPELQDRLLSLLELLQEVVSLHLFLLQATLVLGVCLYVCSWLCFCSVSSLGFTSFQRSEGYGDRGYDLPDECKNTAQVVEFRTWIVLRRLGTRSSKGCSFFYKKLSVFVSCSHSCFLFVCFKMVEQSKESNLGMQLRSIQKLFSSTFPFDGSNNDTKTALDGADSSQSSLLIDLSCCLQDTKVTIPTLNG